MLGEVLREARIEKGLTLAELAKKIEVSTGYVSHLERDKVEPSLTVLRKLSSILDIPVAMLFANNGDQEEVVVTRKIERNKIKYRNLVSDCEVLTPLSWRNSNSADLEVIQLDVPPKSKLSSDDINYDYDECIYVIKGELEYHLGDSLINLNEGGSIYIPKKTGHNIFNNSDEVATIVWIAKV